MTSPPTVLQGPYPPALPAPATTTGDIGGRARRAARWVVRGREDDPRWVRPVLLALIAGTAVMYLWALGASGWSNDFYAAAVQAGSKSWKAFFFGSFDSSNFITVDKPPAFLWVMDLSARIFGLNSWSLLVPEAIEGMLTVLLVYATVRRWFSPLSGLIAAAVLATTPVAVLMFKMSDPDALLLLLLVASVYCTVRAIDSGKTRWLLLAGTAVGFAFLTKQLAAFLVLPALGRRIPAGRAAQDRAPHRSGPARWPRGRGLGRLVGRGGAAHPGRGPAVRRRVDQQQLLAADLRLQRLRPADRQRDRIGRLRQRSRPGFRRRRELDALVRQRNGWPGCLAASRAR